MSNIRLGKLAILGHIALLLSFSPVIGYAADDAPANEPSGASEEKLVTLQLSNTPVIDAIDYLFKGTGYKYTIEPGVSGLINLQLNNVAFDRALKVLAEGAGLVYEVKDGRYIIGPKPKDADKSAVSASEREERRPGPETATPYEEPIAASDESPVFYGQDYLPDAYPSDEDILTAILLAPQFVIVAGPPSIEAPDVFPPPGLRSPSIRRLIEQKRFVDSLIIPRPFGDNYPLRYGYVYVPGYPF